MTKTNTQERRAEARREQLRRLDCRRIADVEAAESAFLFPDSDMDFADQQDAVNNSRRRDEDHTVTLRYAMLVLASCLLVVLGALVGHLAMKG